MLETNLLVNEIQLDNKLSQCVHASRRADFALMLAMLTEDVRQSAEFQLPHIEVETSPTLSQELRMYFSLPERQALAIDDITQIDQYSQAELVHENRLSDLQLTDALKPLPLAFRDDKTHIPLPVFDNMSVHTQHKLKNTDLSLPVTRLPFNAKAWLKNIQQSVLLNNIDLITDKVHSIA